MSQNSETRIGFPAPLLGEQPLRLPVLHDDGERFVLDKPPGVQVLHDNWYPRLPSLTEALNLQAAQGKPELQRLGIPASGAFAAYMIDPFISGPVLYARHEETATEMRNAWGSGAYTFTFHLLASTAPATPEVLCELPLARHATRPEMLVSHRTGKKCSTRFRCLRRFGRFSLWEATTTYARPHQILLHAFESGISVVGDPYYAKVPVPSLEELKSDYRPGREPPAPLYPGPVVHLCSVSLDASTSLSAPVPPHFSVLLRHLGRFCR